MESPLSFYLFDHLGNTRVTFRADAADAIYITYAADYYPYGKILRQYKACNQNRYLSTHHERDKATGYDNRGARLYDSEIGRFLGVDPLADHPNQIMMSPYQYVWGNPVSLTDPDGRCPWCAQLAKRAAVGAAIETVTQVGVNLLKGDSFESAVTNIDYADVTAGAAEGMVLGGMRQLQGSGKRLLAAAGLELFQASVDISIEKGVDYVFKEGSDKSVSQVTVDGTIGLVAGKIGDFLSSTIKAITNSKAIDELSTVERGLRRSMKGSNGEATREVAKSNLEKTIKGNSTVAEETGRVTTEAIEEKAKNEYHQ